MSTPTTNKKSKPGTKKSKPGKKKSNPGKKKFPCTGDYVTHSWDNEKVGGPITPKILESCCLRCGVKFETVYNFRKGLTIKRYHATK